jgi:membrane protease YdiL (CAAX protease family)
MMYLKTRPAWSQLLIFIGLSFGCFLALSLVGTMFLSKITGLDVLQMSNESNWDYSNPATLTFLRGNLLIQFLSLFIIPSFLFAYFSDPAPVKYLGLKNASPVFFLLGAVVLIIAIPFVDWLGVFNHQLIPETTGIGKWMKQSEETASKIVAFMLKKNSLQDLFMNLLFVAVFAGVGEELFFRGVLQRIFIRLLKNPMAGILVTAFVFSAIHFQFYGFIPRFILGILLGMVYWYSGSLWPAIVAHVIYDGFAVVAIYFNPSLADQDVTLPIGNQVIAGIISAIATGVLVYLMKKKTTNSYETVYAEESLEEINPFTPS